MNGEDEVSPGKMAISYDIDVNEINSIFYINTFKFHKQKTTAWDFWILAIGSGDGSGDDGSGERSRDGSGDGDNDGSGQGKANNLTPF